MTIGFDGRTARKNRNIDAMLYVGLMMVQRGYWRPTAKEVAGAAHLSLRTFFQSFGTVDDYYRTLLERHEASLRACLPANIGTDLIRIAITGRPEL